MNSQHVSTKPQQPSKTSDESPDPRIQNKPHHDPSLLCTILKYHIGIMKYIVSVSKTYIHRGNHRHKSTTKKYWHIYYYDQERNFKTERVNYLQALYYKTRKVRRIKYFCAECSQFFLGLVKLRNEKIECPYCSNL